MINLPVCAHREFLSKVDVEIVDDKASMESRYVMEVRINCRQCGLPFQFVGLPAGQPMLAFPTCTKDLVEARLPIRPHQLDISL